MSGIEDKAAAQARYQAGIQRLTELSAKRQQFQDQQYQMAMQEYNKQKQMVDNQNFRENTTWTDEGLQGAGLGASIGSMFAPGLGTAIGAGIGGLAGAALGIGKGAAYIHDTKHKGWGDSIGQELFHTNQSSGFTPGNVMGAGMNIAGGMAQGYHQNQANAAYENNADRMMRLSQYQRAQDNGTFNQQYRGYNQSDLGMMGPDYQQPEQMGPSYVPGQGGNQLQSDWSNEPQQVPMDISAPQRKGVPMRFQVGAANSNWYNPNAYQEIY